jgi:hypothetical protein
MKLIVKKNQTLAKISFMCMIALFTSCAEPNATEIAKSCVASDLVSQCPIGTIPKLNADASSDCSSNASINLEEGISSIGSNSSISQVCVGSGSCQLVCELTQPCLEGIKEISKDKIVCNSLTDDVPCGDNICAVGENPMNCPQDCDAICTPLTERCNGLNREVCNNRGATWDTLACQSPTICIEIGDQKTQCRNPAIMLDMSQISNDLHISDQDMGMVDMEYGVIDQQKVQPFFKHHLNQGSLVQNNNVFKLKSTITTMQFKSKNLEYQLRSTLNP